MLLEATGGLELPLVASLAAAALPVVVVNPRQVRDFAKATGTLAKTDALDAGVLAHFADAVRPEVRPLKDAETQVLNSLTARRHQVMTMLVSEKNRLGTAIGTVSPRIEAHIAMTMLVSEKNRLGTAIGAVSPRIEAHIAWLEQELSDLDKGLRQTLRRSPVWREKDDLLRTVPGVGEQISLTLLANLPELGTLNRGRSPPLWAWPPTTATVAPCGANAPSGADAPGCGPSSTWERWYPAATTLLSGTSTRGCWLLASRKRWRWSRPCANCWLYSTACSNMAPLGAT